MQLNVHEARELVVRIMSAIGHDAADAGLIADRLIDCELRGLSYGTTRPNRPLKSPAR